MAAAPSPSVIKLDECASTNTWLAEHYTSLEHGTVVYTPCQSAGRGQRGNSWEAEPGKNITMSMLLRPKSIKPREQFHISEIVALAVAEMLDSNGVPKVSIKWPNDIYSGDSKICGILIEHKLEGIDIEATIAGIGINVNQREFRSDAPNPVSIWQLTGKELNIVKLTQDVAQRICEMMETYDTAGADFTPLHHRYLDRLWRRNTPSPYIDTACGTEFTATIADVEPAGMLHLRDEHGKERIYAFKEVAFKL